MILETITLFNVIVDSSMTMSWNISNTGVYFEAELFKKIGDTTFVWNRIDHKDIPILLKPYRKFTGNDSIGSREEWELTDQDLWQFRNVQFRDSVGFLKWEVTDVGRDTTDYTSLGADSVRACYRN